VSCGPLLGGRRIAAEWQIAEILKSRGAFEDPDLANLPSFARYGGSDESIAPDEFGRWHFQQTLGYSYGRWGNTVTRWALTNQMDLAEVRRIADALYSPGGFVPGAWSDLKKVTLWVPIDLRLSVEHQYERLIPSLKTIQAFLLELSGRSGVQRVEDPDVLFRDVYCYLLSSKGNKTAAEIAAEVFPRERASSRAVKVRKILSNVRRALAARTRSRGVK
jgi:hypothetical protein